MPPFDAGTPFRNYLWNLPQWIYTAHWALVILCGALIVQSRYPARELDFCCGGGGVCMWM